MSKIVLEKIEKIIEPILNGLGYEFVAGQFVNEAGGQILRIYIDSENGISLGDCRKASRAVEDIIEVEELITQKYRLELSSPGLDRPLRKKNDFVKFKGKEIKLESKCAIDGRKRWRGELVDLINDEVLINVDGQLYKIPFDEVYKAKLVPDTFN